MLQTLLPKQQPQHATLPFPKIFSFLKRKKKCSLLPNLGFLSCVPALIERAGSELNFRGTLSENTNAFVVPGQTVKSKKKRQLSHLLTPLSGIANQTIATTRRQQITLEKTTATEGTLTECLEYRFAVPDLPQSVFRKQSSSHPDNGSAAQI